MKSAWERKVSLLVMWPFLDVSLKAAHNISSLQYKIAFQFSTINTLLQTVLSEWPPVMKAEDIFHKHECHTDVCLRQNTELLSQCETAPSVTGFANFKF